ncbi:MAG: NADH-quinone oxidoreductase subunit NuoH [Acidobacteriales bacterium]|nr:NADH-quinone oxidoreductase subunit NuoH [Terriglobales bacterium]
MIETLKFVAFLLLKIVVITHVLLGAVAYTVWLERKLIGRMQNRWGPTRVGPFGLLQPIADGVKFILKEDMLPPGVNKPLFVLAPLLAVALGLTSLAVIPFGETVSQLGKLGALQISGFVRADGSIMDPGVGLLIILAVTSIGVYGIALAGWSSNSKYSLLGSLRASAQMVSYELSLGLSLVGVIMLSGSLSLRQIVDAQAGPFWHWNVFVGLQFIAFFIYLTAAYAETNRIPFDLPEAETELVAGYHTEYSAMKFAMFFMAEYANMFTASCVATLLFFGGWHSPLEGLVKYSLPPLLAALEPVFWFAAKIFVFIFVYIWIRGTLPRFRYDQLMAFGWKVLLPLAIANIVVTSLYVAWRTV